MKNGQYKFLPSSKKFNVVQFMNLWNSLIGKKILQTMHNKYKEAHDEHLAYTPYAIPNVAMANYTT